MNKFANIWQESLRGKRYSNEMFFVLLEYFQSLNN
jgi:hypothetical protein